MKKALLIGLVVVVVLPGLAGSGLSHSSAETFAGYFLRQMQTLKVDVSAEERNALLTVHRLLLVGAGDKEFTSTFWQIVRAEDPREISWEDATGLVRNGAIHTICQDHDLRVLLYARDGRKYRTREPHIDDVGRIRAEVDPTGVFIRLVTE